MVIKRTIKKTIIFGLILQAVTCVSSVKEVFSRSSNHYSKIKKASSRTFTKSSLSQTYSHIINHAKVSNDEYLWQSTAAPFSELIFSWNAIRPRNKSGKFIFYVSILHSKWSEWIKVAEWGSHIQRSFLSKKDKTVSFRVAPITLKNRVVGKGFKVRVIASDGANLNDVKYLFACASNPEKFKIEIPRDDLEDVWVDGVPKRSQMELPHPKAQHLCAPTSTSTVINYFLKHTNDYEENYVDPIEFAEEVRDQFFGVYGNSVLNVAAAFDNSNGRVPCCVERLNNFEQLHSYLKRNIPVVVSIHGPIRGGAMSYKAGHLMIVTGWANKPQSVLCIDPAFKTSSATETCYAIKDFLKAWARSRNLSYVFMPDGLA